MSPFFEFAVILGFFAFPFPVFQDAPEQAKKADLEVTAEATLQNIGVLNTYRAELDLGLLPKGKNVAVVFKLKNPFDKPIEFSEALVNCSCVGFDSAKKVIPPGESTLFKLNLATASVTNSPDVQSGITLIKKDSDPTNRIRIGVSIRYRMKNFIRFDKAMNNLELKKSSDSIQTYDLPFSISDPIKTENIEVSLSGSLRDLIAEVAEVNSRPVVRISVAEQAINKGSIAGEVTIVDKSSKSESVTYFSARSREAVKISPTVLRFAKDEGKTGEFTACAILRLSPSSSKNEQKQSNQFKTTDNISVDIVFEDLPKPKILVRKLGDSILRASILITLDADELKKIRRDGLNAEWAVSGQGLLWKGKTKGIILNR
jgi:hypothetical protein